MDVVALPHLRKGSKKALPIVHAPVHSNDAVVLEEATSPRIAADDANAVAATTFKAPCPLLAMAMGAVRFIGYCG